MPKIKLKPCPFCGSETAPRAQTVAECELMDEDDENYKWSSEHYTVVCGIYEGGCGASIKCNNETKQEAIEAWNRRPELNLIMSIPKELHISYHMGNALTNKRTDGMKIAPGIEIK